MAKQQQIFIKELFTTIPMPTPLFVFSKNALENNYGLYKKYFPAKTEICYAVKANSELPILKTLFNLNSSFEVASKYELALLKKLHVPPHKIIYGSAIKPEAHIKAFTDHGVDRFAFDSEQELVKIAKYSPRARVYVRALVKDASDSVFTMSEKFGVDIEEAIRLLLKAKEMGLVPYGVSFSVGSQARNGRAWANGIQDINQLMRRLKSHGIRLRAINLGGGFPHSYQSNDDFPLIATITDHIRTAITKLPYPVSLIIEPGRGLVANTFTLITTIIAKATRASGEWLYVDAGVYNALMEALTCQGSTNYRIEALNADNSTTAKPFILSGLTGDALDVITRRAMLPANIHIGDTLAIYDTGAYTTALATNFNGFPKPKIITI